MVLKAKPLVVPDDNPFANDALNRQATLEGLTKLISQVNGPFVLALNSPWGTGKSTLIEMWQKLLTKDKQPTIYFNAWKSDFTRDPLVAVIAEFDNAVKALGLKNEKYKKAMKIAKKAVLFLGKRAVPAAAKIASAGVLDLEKFNEEVIADSVEKAIEGVFDHYSKEKEVGETFKKSLEGLVKSIQTPENQKKLIVFIDEMDRCRPDYSVNLLERLKHYLSVEGVVYVLAIDRDQIGTSLKSIYGEGLNSKEYLRRFIDLEITLPPPDPDRITKSLMERYGFNHFFVKRTHPDLAVEKDAFIGTFNELSQLCGLSLRAREQCFTRIAIAMALTPENQYFHPILVTPLVIAKEAIPDLYSNYAFGGWSADEFIRGIGERNGGAHFRENRISRIIEAFMVVAKTRNGMVEEELKNYDSIVNSVDATPAEKERAKRVAELIRDLAGSLNGIPVLNMVLKKIELAFTFS